nr:MAG TPA: nuclease [Caudoviricetes sp.]
MPLKRSEYNAILSKNKKRQEFKEKLRKYTESYTNPQKITDTNETARIVEQTKPVQTGGSPALTAESNPAYINNMSGASARQTLAQNAPYGKVFDKDAFMRQQAISAVTPTTIRSSDNFTANALQRAANSAANNMAIAYTGDPSKKNTPLASAIDASATFKNVSDEFTKEYNELLDLNLQYKQAKAKISGDKKGTISKDAEEHAAKANEISALIDAKRKKVDALSNQLDTMAAMNPAVYSSKRTYPDGRTMYIPSKEKVNSAFFGNVAYLGDRTSQGVQSSTDDIRDFLSNMTYGLPQQFSSLVQGKEAMDNAQNAWQEHKDKIALENVEKQENRAQDTYERYSPTITENGAMQLLGDLSENIGYNAPYQLLAMIPGVGTGLSTTARFGGSYIDAYGNARKAGASVEQANLAGTLEGFNQGVGELVLGGINGAGSSRILQGLSKAGLKVSNPLVKAGLNAAGAALEEGLEEVEQDIISYFIEKTYNPDAKLNAKDLAYSGLLGALSAAPNAAISIPSHARAYSSDVKLMNSYITAVSSVSSDTEVNAIIEAGDNIIKACDEMASAAKEQGGEEGKEAQNRAETIAKTIKNTQETLNKNKDAVIKGNQDKKSALDNVVNNSKGDVVNNLANLVDEVSKGNNTGKNDYKATVDYILNQQAEAEAKYQQAASIEDTETAAKYAADSAAYAEAVRQLRNNQKEVQKARASEETYGDVTAEETKTTVAEANTTADEAKTATAETSENAAKSSETTEKQETPKEKGDSLRDSILKEHGILGVNKDIDTAADDIVAKYGSYKNAVDKIIEAQKNVREDTTISDEEKQTQISRLQDIIRSIRNRNTARQREAIENFSKIVKKYGLEGVEFIDVESDDVRSSPKVNGYYDPATKKIYVSPYSQDIQTSGSIVVHELTHHGATADHALVNDILKAKDTLVSKGQYSEELFDYSKYETTYKAETEKYINSEDGKAEIAALVKNGMTEEQAIAEAAKGYVNEEIAAHFMQEIMSNDDALKRLAKEDRPLLKRILDAIVNFFSGKKHRNERMAMLAADKIRSILRATEDVKVDNSRGKKPKATKPMQNIADENAKVGNTSDNRRFSLTRSTEEAGDLIAVHNVTEDKLEKILGADGMPMPSIAVAKADIGHSDFGNISLVFGSETVDPKANRNNKVYSADVWSPTFPSVEYEVNQATESRIVALYNSIKSKYGSDVAKALYPYYTNLSSELDSKGGAKGIVSSLSNDTKMMNVFLADTGETPVKNVVKETSTEMNENTREMGQYLIDTLGKEFVNEANPVNGETAISARNRFLESHEQELRNALQRYYENNGLDEETAKTVVDATRKGELMSQLVKPAKSILSGNTTTTSTTIDYEATNEKILDTVDKKQYKEWLNNLFGDAVKNEGIRNGKDPFTPSGNRRSFSATHYPVTLDNIVKAMRGAENVKGATTMTENAKAIRSASAEEYKSIDAIHKNEGRLQKMSESEITAQWDAFDNRLYAIIDSLMDSVPTIDDRLIESRRIGQVIIEASRNPTESNIRSTLEKYSGKGAWYKFTDQTVSDIQSLVNDIREAPTNIFEAKPERVVGLDEVKYAVVPDDLSKETVRAIADKGIEVRTYESGNEESRLETLNNLDGVRFSKDVDTDSENIRYSKEVDADGKPYVRVDDSSIDAENPSDIVKVLRDIAESKGFYNMEINGQNIGISNKRGINEWVFSRDATNLLKNDKQTFDDKMQSFQNANELLETAKSFINEEAVHKKKFDNFARGVVRFMVGDNGYTADILVGIRNNQNAELYDIVNIAPTKIAETPNDSVVGETTQISNGISADTSLPQSGESVNRTGESVTEMKQSNGEFRNSKDVFTQEEREKIISKGYTDYLTRQFVVKDKSGEYAKAISMTARKKLAQQLAKPLNGVTVNDTLAAITPVFETIEKTDGTPEQRAAKAYEAAEKAANTILSMVKDANTNPLYEQYSDLRTYLRITKLDTSSVKADIADYNEWRKSHMGSMKLGNDGTQIDTAYQELSDMYPEFFPADIVNPADQLIRMGEVSDKLKKVMENPILSQEGSESIVRGFANAILAGYENSAETTLAAKNKQSEEDFARFVTTITRAYETDVRNLSKQLDSSNAKIEKMAESIAKKDETGRRETSRKKALSGVSRLQKAMNEPTLSKNIPENWKKVVETFLKAMGNEDYKNAKKSTHEPKFDPHEALSALAEMQSYVNDFQNSKESTIRMPADQIKNLEWQISGIRADLENYIHDNKNNLNAKDISLVTSQDANWLANIADLTQTINHLIKQENELFVGKKKMDAEQFASELIEQINERKRKFQKTGEEDSDIKKWITNSQFDYVAPDIYLHMLGERGDDLANAYRLGQDKISANKQKYVDAIKELVGENFSAEKSSIRGELIDVKINGDAMKVSRQQLMSMYVLWYRPQARQHMETGGVFFLNRNGEPQGKPVVITQSIFNDLAKNLTKDDIRIANGIRNFLSTECAEWGNEASMEMYGYKKFNDPNYFPINVHGDTLAYNVGKAPDSNVLERKGFTKKVDPNSIKPIDIRDIFDVADKHVEDMTMYAGYAPINSTTLRIYNAPGVKSAIREQYGNNAVRYMEGFLYKANGLANENNTAPPKLYYWNKLANAGKKAAVAFNISTAAKQPLSYFRAGIELDTKYLVNAWSDVLPKKKYDALLQEMNENSGIAKIKSLGYSDVGMGHDTRSQYSDQTFKGAYKKGEYIKNKFEDASMYLAGKADERTWVRIWDACKMKVEAENGKLTHQELMSLTTEKFNQVIGRTQVVDSLMDTAPIAYDPKFKAFFPFSNEPIKTMATLYYTWNDMKKGKGKEGFTKAVSSSVLTNLILVPLVSSMMGVWRDKEDEDPLTYIEKVIEHWTGLGIGEDSETSFTSIITSEMVDGVFVDPILSGLFEIFTDIIQGYSGDVMNSSGLYDLGESSKRLLNAIMKGEDYKGEKSTYNLTMEFIASVAQILGVPANTLRRDTNAAIRTVLYYAQNVIPASNIARWELNKLYYNLGNKSARTEKYFYDILVDAYNQEDKTAYNIMREDLDKMGIQSKEIVGIIEKRGGVIKPGTSVWNTEVQARFDLPTKSTGNKVEQMVTRVYTACQKIDTLDENKALPKRPEKYYYTNDDGDKVEMTTQEYDKFVEDVGVLRYKLCAEMAASNGWSKLSAEQQLYALTKAYDFAARYYRQKFNKDYNSGDTWMKELYGTQFRNKEVASTIISKAFKK